MDHSPFAYASGAPPPPTSTSGASPTLSNYTQDSNPSVSSSYGGMPSSASAAGFNTTAARASQPPVLTPASSAGPPATPLACLACRGKHLKCDGGNPCLRCVAFNSECVYVASRRGYKGPSRKAAAAANPNKRMRSSSTSPPPSSTQSESCPMMLGMPAVSMPGMVTSSSFTPGVRLDTTMPMAPTTSAALSPYISLTPGPPARMAQHTPDPSHLQLYRTSYLTADLGEAALAVTLPTQPVTSMGQKCFDSFYHHFFAAHPFVLPKDNMIRLVNEGSAKLDHLLAAMRYIGSLFVDAGPARAMYLDEALRLAYLPSCPRDGFLVQTLLMLIVGLDGNCNQEKARELLGDCERLALEIGLNGRPFATANGRSDPTMEESWRRTWWDLFVVDGMVAGVHRVTNFLLYDVESTVALPCEEHQYLSGSIPMPMYIEDFDDQVFSGEDREFSSFAYRIAAARILGRFMRCPPILFPDDENMGKIESLLTNWRIHLPPGKRDNLTKNCTLDEMMFQAHFMNHACSILLHQPHSQLDSSPARSVNSCAPHSVVPSGDAFNTHTRHTITAACEISKMITQAVPLHSHTHFFTCVITLSSIVHLSKWALYFIQDEEDLRQLIRLNIGALGKLSDVWKAAATASGQVRGVAQEIYRAKKAQQINPAFWVGFTQEEMIQSLNADEGIMSEFNSMSGFGQVPTTMAISQPMSQP